MKKEKNIKSIFLWHWLSVTLVVIMVSLGVTFVAERIISDYTKLNFPTELFWIVPIVGVLIMSVIRWFKRDDVPANHVAIIDWLGDYYQMNPGRHYTFPYLGKILSSELIETNRIVLGIFIGVMTDSEKENYSEYEYGTRSNVETKGDFVRLLLRLEVQVMDAIKLCKNLQKPYEYIVGLCEKEVRTYAGKLDNDKLDKEFPKKVWTPEIAEIEKDFKILENTGIKIHSLISVDVINTPEVEEFNRRVQEADKEGRVIDNQIKNKVKLEKGEGLVLDEKINNISKRKTIGRENDEILKHSIETVQKTSNAHGDVVLRFINDREKYATVRGAAEAGGIVYVENGGGSSNAGMAAGLTWGVNAANAMASKNNKPAPTKDAGKANAKAKGKAKDDDDDDDE